MEFIPDLLELIDSNMDNLPDGAYLEMMNILKKIKDHGDPDVKRLYRGELLRRLSGIPGQNWSGMSKHNNGEIVWHEHGVLHRNEELGPAIIRSSGQREWYRRGVLHREDGPALITSEGDQEWRFNGLRHRVDGPTTIKSDGTQLWFRDGALHREDGPAIIMPDGSQGWFNNDVLHRTDGPAIIMSDGTEELYFYGHRIEKIDIKIEFRN